MGLQRFAPWSGLSGSFTMSMEYRWGHMGETNLTQRPCLPSSRSQIRQISSNLDEKTSENYSIEAMVSRFESVVTRTLAGERNIEVSSKNRLTLAPWCDVQGDSIYDDYTATSSKYPELTAQ
jgi:hypothetical protein